MRADFAVFGDCGLLDEVGAAATHILILETGDSGVIQCPSGVLVVASNTEHELTTLCGDAIPKPNTNGDGLQSTYDLTFTAGS